MTRFKRATAFAAAFALAAAFGVVQDQPAYAKNDKAQGQQKVKQKGKPDHAGKGDKGKKGGGASSLDREFSRDYRDEDVVDEFRRYTRERGDRTPDYLRGNSDLPPGIAKNLKRGKPLPPGIAKKVGDDALLGRLPSTLPGSEWYVAGDRLVEYDPVSEAILHVIESTLYGGF